MLPSPSCALFLSWIRCPTLGHVPSFATFPEAWAVPLLGAKKADEYF